MPVLCDFKAFSHTLETPDAVHVTVLGWAPLLEDGLASTRPYSFFAFFEKNSQRVCFVLALSYASESRCLLTIDIDS